jgi:AmmeMemoRadiSam system protein B/AmmeMemoRadiSam system protein A
MGKRVSLILSIFIALFSCTAKESSATVKKSALAGRWYSSNAAELAGQIDTLLERAIAQKDCPDPVFLILPHAGYQYSGKTAAAGYRKIGIAGKSTINPGLIVILGPSHYKAFHGCATISADYFETPLGRVRVETRLAGKLLAASLFKTDPSAFEQEHSIEIHLPFLQRIFGDRLSGEIRILPILVGELDDADARRAAATIASAVAGTRPLFIISSDFTHYGPNFSYLPFKNRGGGTASKIKELDFGALHFILRKDLGGFSNYIKKTEITICGKNPIKIALALPMDSYRAENIWYDTSGSVTGDYTNSVSYASVLFCGSMKSAGERGKDARAITLDDKKFLVKAARDNIISWLDTGRGINFLTAAVPDNCLAKKGAFVTLKSRGYLRGCIGYVNAEMPLIQTILHCSYNAAFKDPRFMPVRSDELKDISIEISVLSDTLPVRLPDEIQTGRDGLIVERGRQRGLLLPQVAVEQGWDRYAFLSQTCVKAGLPPGAWKESTTRIYRFEAIVFSEEALE